MYSDKKCITCNVLSFGTIALPVTLKNEGCEFVGIQRFEPESHPKRLSHEYPRNGDTPQTWIVVWSHVKFGSW